MVQFDRVHPVSRETNVWDSLPYPTEFFLHPYPQREYGRAYADLITKFSGIDRFPFFLGMRIYCACGRSAKNS